MWDTSTAYRVNQCVITIEQLHEKTQIFGFRTFKISSENNFKVLTFFCHAEKLLEKNAKIIFKISHVINGYAGLFVLHLLLHLDPKFVLSKFVLLSKFVYFQNCRLLSKLKAYCRNLYCLSLIHFHSFYFGRYISWVGFLSLFPLEIYYVILTYFMVFLFYP